MKRIILLLCFLLSLFVGFGQSRQYIRADSVYIQSGSNGELIVLNATRDSTGGILINKGSGRTTFAKLRAINDSTLVVGKDTIVIRGTGGGANLKGAGGVTRSNDTFSIGGALDKGTLLHVKSNRRDNKLQSSALVIYNSDTATIQSTLNDLNDTTSYFEKAGLYILKHYNNDDTLPRICGGAIYGLTRSTFSPGNKSFINPANGLLLPYGGSYMVSQLFPPDSTQWAVGPYGTTGGAYAGDVGIGGSNPYYINIYDAQPSLGNYPLAAMRLGIDYASTTSNIKREVYGVGSSGYVWDFRSQQSNINSGSTEYGSYVNKVSGFHAYGSLRPHAESPSKTKTMAVSKVDTAVAFLSEPMRTTLNEVNNGYGFVTKGAEDYNWFAGKTRIGGTWPTRGNGALQYNLETIGSLRSDTIFNLYQKFDSTGRINFISKNSPAYDAGGYGRFLIDMRTNIDSNATGADVPGGLFSFRNYTDYKTNTYFSQAMNDARSYYTLNTNRTAKLERCATCPNDQFYGYSDISLGSNSRLSTGDGGGNFPHTIFLARNTIRGTTPSPMGKASTLDLVNYIGLFELKANVDSLRSATNFLDYGMVDNSVSRIGGYYSFKTSVVNAANADSVFGFYQSQANVRNKFYGTLELPSLSLTNDSASYKVVVTNANGKLFKSNWIGAAGGGGVTISDVAYGPSWNGNTTDGASKNAIYDKINALEADSVRFYNANGRGSPLLMPISNTEMYLRTPMVRVNGAVSDTSQSTDSTIIYDITDTNFGNADINFTGNRTHKARGFDLTIDSMNNLSLFSEGTIGTRKTLSALAFNPATTIGNSFELSYYKGKVNTGLASDSILHRIYLDASSNNMHFSTYFNIGGGKSNRLRTSKDDINLESDSAGVSLSRVTVTPHYIQLNALDSILINGVEAAATADSALGVVYSHGNPTGNPRTYRMVKFPVPAGGGGGGISGTGTSGRLTYWNGTSSVTSDANLLYASTNNGTLSVGTTNTQGHLNLGGDKNISSTGGQSYFAPATYTDIVTSASGTASGFSVNYIGPPTMAASNTAVTHTNDVTLTVDPPTAGTNVTITNSYAIMTGTNGHVRFQGNLTVSPLASGGTQPTTSGAMAVVMVDANGKLSFLKPQSVSSSATVTPTSSNNVVSISAQAVGLTIANPTGTFLDGQAILIQIKDNGSSQTITWGSDFLATDFTLPNATVAGKWTILQAVYNASAAKLFVTGKSQQP